MSLRQVRRLLLPQEQNLLSDATPDEQVERVESEGKGLNRYELVTNHNVLVGCLTGSFSLQLLESEPECQPEENGDSSSSNETTDVPIPGKKKRRKKKKNKVTESKPDDEKVAEDPDDNELVSESLPTSSVSKPEAMRAVNILRIEKRYLNYENEKLAVMYKNSHLANKLTHSTKRHGRDHRTEAAHLMANPKHWYKLSKSAMTMELERKEGDVSFFRLIHKPEYQAMQQKLLEALESPDPGCLIALLQLYPTHPELLLQVSDLVHADDQKMAAELVERAVSIFESLFHPRFLLSLGYSRLDYRRNESRPLFVALFKHVCALGRKSCYRTALEVCKLLLSLDVAGDPLAVLHMIDFYALMSNQTDFLMSLYEAWKDEKKLHILPNYCFSIAFAHFKKATAQKQVNQNLMHAADQLLRDALLRFPAMLLLLLDKCSVDPDSSVVQCGIFPSGVHQEAQVLRQLLTLYADRSSILWSSDRESIRWLERNVHLLIEQLEESRSTIQANKDLLVKFYSDLTPRNILRHVLLTDFKDSRSCLPLDTQSERLYAFDPLPPADAIQSYEIQLKKPATTGNSSILGLFLHSWLPDFDPDATASQESDGNRLKSSISCLMDAMKNLLTTVNQHDEDE